MSGMLKASDEEMKRQANQERRMRKLQQQAYLAAVKEAKKKTDSDWVLMKKPDPLDVAEDALKRRKGGKRKRTRKKRRKKRGGATPLTYFIVKLQQQYINAFLTSMRQRQNNNNLFLENDDISEDRLENVIIQLELGLETYREGYYGIIYDVRRHIRSGRDGTGYFYLDYFEGVTEVEERIAEDNIPNENIFPSNRADLYREENTGNQSPINIMEVDDIQQPWTNGGRRKRKTKRKTRGKKRRKRKRKTKRRKRRRKKTRKKRGGDGACQKLSGLEEYGLTKKNYNKSVNKGFKNPLLNNMEHIKAVLGRGQNPWHNEEEMQNIIQKTKKACEEKEDCDWRPDGKNGNHNCMSICESKEKNDEDTCLPHDKCVYNAVAKKCQNKRGVSYEFYLNNLKMYGAQLRERTRRKKQNLKKINKTDKDRTSPKSVQHLSVEPPIKRPKTI